MIDKPPSFEKDLPHIDKMTVILGETDERMAQRAANLEEHVRGCPHCKSIIEDVDIDKAINSYYGTHPDISERRNAMEVSRDWLQQDRFHEEELQILIYQVLRERSGKL